MKRIGVTIVVVALAALSGTVAAQTTQIQAYSGVVSLLRAVESGELDEAVAEVAIEIAVDIASGRGEGVPSFVQILYPADQAPFADADQLLAAGRTTEARQLAESMPEEVPRRFAEPEEEETEEEESVYAAALVMLEGGGTKATTNQLAGIELAIAVATEQKTPIPGDVLAVYPDDQVPYQDADQLLAAGLTDEARALAATVDETPPDRFDDPESLSDRVGEWTATIGAFALAVAIGLAIAWILLLIMRRIWARRPWSQEVEFKIGTIEEGPGVDSGNKALVHAVITSELTFAGTSGNSVFQVGGPGAELKPVELPDQLKPLQKAVDWLGRPSRYQLDGEVYFVDDDNVVLSARLSSQRGRVVQARRFSWHAEHGDKTLALRQVAIRAASWAAFELQRLSRWPRLPKKAKNAPGLLGTTRVDSYALYRMAMIDEQPDRDLLEQALAISDENIGALIELARIITSEATPESGRALRPEEDAEIDRALVMLRNALHQLERFPTIVPRFGLKSLLGRRMARLTAREDGEVVVRSTIGGREPGRALRPSWNFCDRLAGPKGIILRRGSQIDTLWYRVAYRLAVSEVHAYFLRDRASGGRRGDHLNHLEQATEVSLALTRAAAATRVSVAEQVGASFTSWLAIGRLSRRRALLEMLFIDGQYLASLLAGAVVAARREGRFTAPLRINASSRMEDGDAYEPSVKDRETLEPVWWALSLQVRYPHPRQLLDALERIDGGDPRFSYNLACVHAQDISWGGLPGRILGLTAQPTDRIGERLRKAFGYDSGDANEGLFIWVRKDPTFDRLRKRHRQEFDDLLGDLRRRPGATARSAEEWHAVDG